MDKDMEIEERPSTSKKVGERTKSRDEDNDDDREDGADRRSELSGTNSEHSKLVVIKSRLKMLPGAREAKQQKSDNKRRERKRKQTRLSGRVKKRTSARPVTRKKPDKRKLKVMKRRREPSYSTIFTRLSSASASSIGSCKYCGHRCSKRRYEVKTVKRRVKTNKKNNKRKTKSPITLNCVSTQTAGSVGIQAATVMLSPLRIGSERPPEKASPENTMYCEITPDMIFNSLRSLTMWRIGVHIENLVQYIQRHYPVNSNSEELETELREKLRIAAIVGFVKCIGNNIWALNCKLEKSKLTKNHVTLFWMVYGDTMRPIVKRNVQNYKTTNDANI